MYLHVSNIFFPVTFRQLFLIHLIIIINENINCAEKSNISSTIVILKLYSKIIFIIKKLTDIMTLLHTNPKIFESLLDFHY